MVSQHEAKGERGILTAIDQFLDSTGEDEITVFVKFPLVTRAEPAV